MALPSDCLLSLPMHMLEVIVKHSPTSAKLQLLRTCKVLREVVLRKEARLTLTVDLAWDEFKHRGALDVINGRQQLSLRVEDGAGQHAQRLLSELASQSALGERHSVVSDLEIYGVLHDRDDPDDQETVSTMSNLAGLVGGAFPSLTSLKLEYCSLDASICSRLRTLSMSNPFWLVNAADLSALSLCQQLEEIYLDYINNPILEVLLELPKLSTVSCGNWTADAGGRSCSWSSLRLSNDVDTEHFGGLPSGITTLHIPGIEIEAHGTPGACLAASQSLAACLMDKCTRLAWCGQGGRPSILIHTSSTAKTEAALQGLSTLLPHLQQGLCLTLLSSTVLDAASVQALSVFGSLIRRLNTSCPRSVEAGAWEVLPTVLPAMRHCNIDAEFLSKESLAALEKLCRNAHGLGNALRYVGVTLQGSPSRAGMRSEADVRLLSGRLKAASAPVKLTLNSV